MTRTIQRISLSLACDISFSEPALNRSTINRVTADVSIEQLAEITARRTLLQSFNVRAAVMEGCVAGVDVPIMGLLRVRIAWRSEWEAA
jgi:hypothetical protein